MPPVASNPVAVPAAMPVPPAGAMPVVAPGAVPVAAPVESQRVVPASFNESPSLETAVVTRELLASELAAIEATTDLAEEIRKACTERINKAKEWIDSEEASRKRQQEIEAYLPTIGDLVAETKAALEKPADAEFGANPSGNTIAELESQLAALRQQVEADEAQFAAKGKELEGRTARLADLAKEVVDLEQRIAENAKQAAAATGTDLNAHVQALELRAKSQCRQQQLVTTKLERRRLDETGTLLPLEHDLAQRNLNGRKRMLARWQTAIDQWRKEESLRQATEARRIAETSHPALKSLAEQNAEIAERRIATAAGIERVTKTIKELKEKIQQYEADFETLRDKVEHAGTTSTTGLLLRKQRSELPRMSEFEERTKYIQAEMPAAHLQLTEWKQMRRAVADPEEAAAEMFDSLDASLGDYDRQQVIDVLVRVLRDRRDLLAKAIPDQDTLLQDLNELELVDHRLEALVEEFREFLNQRVLWIRSSDAIELDDVRAGIQGLGTLVNPVRWGQVLRVAGVDLLRRPAAALSLLAFVILLIIFRARLRQTQSNLSDPPAAGQEAKFSRYAAAFMIAVVLSARWPALLLVVGYRLRTAAASTEWTQAVGDACLTMILFLLGCELLRELCRSEGVGEKVFGWPERATASVRNTLEITALVGTPIFGFLLLSQFGELADQQSSQRLLFISILALFVLQIGWLVRPRGPLMKCLSADSPQSLVVRFKKPIWCAVAGAPLAFAILSLVGYHFSAYQLSGRLAETGAAVVAAIVLYSLALRWLEVIGYNRALRDAPAAVRHDEERLVIDSSLSEESVVVEPEPVATVSMHASADSEFRDLLRYAGIMLLVCAGWFIWSEVFPALRVLDRVVLWQNIESVAETVVDSGGGESIKLSDRTVPTTLTDVLMAVLVVVATMMVGRRLPGVVEFVVLERLPMEQGGRQAVAILVRYAATLVGLLFACHIIRLSWGSVQWLAAAMTVGLGFGLQEIFANLVSGLIILFERPIRLTDLVTVGDVTGNVTRMQMRATTITDFDRRELIVPNKKFITDNVINWTLTDPVSRVVLPVGVAYGTDVKKAQGILLRLAKECPYVMREPAPSTLFKSFGDSTLNLELRVFIAKRDVYLDVVNELNLAITREFQKANIEIAFPQRDLHIKSVETLQAILPDVQQQRSAA